MALVGALGIASAADAKGNNGGGNKKNASQAEGKKKKKKENRQVCQAPRGPRDRSVQRDPLV